MLGQAVAKALGDKQGITRYADVHLPMDETLTRVAVDVSGRPYLVWKVDFSTPKLGEMDTELFREWFQAFARTPASRCTSRTSTARTTTTSPRPASRAWRARCAQAIADRPAPGRPRALDQGHARRLIVSLRVARTGVGHLHRA